MPEYNVTRREAVAALGAAGVAGVAGCLGGGEDTPTEDDSMDGNDDDGGDDGSDDTPTPTEQDVSGTVSVGVLQPVSGDLQYYGQQSLWGFLSGLAYRADGDPLTDVTTGTTTYSVGDVDYELHVRDSQFVADTAQSLATDLVESEGVDVLFGTASSGAATRVINTVANPSGTPFIAGPAASAGITSSAETCSDIVFRASENTAMDARSGGAYVANETDIGKVFLFGADYSFGRAVVNNYRTVLEQQGVEIVGERFVPQGHSEWGGLLDNAEEAGAEGIVTGFTVATLPNLFTTYLQGDYSYRAFGGFATQITIGVIGDLLAGYFDGEITREKLEETGLGPFTTRYHWNQYDNEINDAFVDMYTSAYGRVPDLFTAGTFTAASALDQAVHESGSTDGADIAEAMRGMIVTDTPKGENAYEFQEYNNQARSAMTIADVVPTSDEWADSWDAAVMPSEPVATISRDRTTIPAEDVDCSL